MIETLTRREFLRVAAGVGTAALAKAVFDKKVDSQALQAHRVFLPLIERSSVDLFTFEATIAPDGFRLAGCRWLAFGANWRPLEYDHNFGRPPWNTSTVSENSAVIDQVLATMRMAGIRMLRVGLLDSGASFFNGGYTPLMKQDVLTFLGLAGKNGIKTELVLADYLIGARHPSIFTDTVLRQSLTKDLLSRLLTDIQVDPKAKKNLTGIDLVNEPEWLISGSNGGGWEWVAGERSPQPIPIDKMNAYFDEARDTIKSVMPQKLVTVGVSAKHTQVIAGIMSGLDYVGLHHYAYMGPLEQYLGRLPSDKPWSLEEFPTRDEGVPVNPTTYLDKVLGLRDSRATGALMWMWKPIRGFIDDKTDVSMIPHATNWVNSHQEDILRC